MIEKSDIIQSGENKEGLILIYCLNILEELNIISVNKELVNIKGQNGILVFELIFFKIYGPIKIYIIDF